MKTKKLTQHALVNNYIQQIADHLQAVTEEQLVNYGGPLRGLLELRNHLERVLGEAQNRPPLGASDGSIPEKQWTQARKLLTALNDVEWCAENWGRVCRGEEPLR